MGATMFLGSITPIGLKLGYNTPMNNVLAHECAKELTDYLNGLLIQAFEKVQQENSFPTLLLESQKKGVRFKDMSKDIPEIYVEIGSGHGELAEWFLQGSAIEGFLRRLVERVGRGAYGFPGLDEISPKILVTYEIERKFWRKTFKRVFKSMGCLQMQSGKMYVDSECLERWCNKRQKLVVPIWGSGTKALQDLAAKQGVGKGMGKGALQVPSAVLERQIKKSRQFRQIGQIGGSRDALVGAKHAKYAKKSAQRRTGPVLSGVFALFPDPLDNKRARRHRPFTAEFFRTLCGLLKPGGFVFIVTDHPEYAGFILENMQACCSQAQCNPHGAPGHLSTAELQPACSFWHTTGFDPADWALPATHYFKKWARIGKENHVFVLHKRPNNPA